MRLTSSHFTGADLGISSLLHNVALTPDTPPADSMAFFNWSAVSTSWPELRYIQSWLLIVAALRSHYPLPPCGSEKSSFTLMWYLLATCWIASNVDALWEHPALSCLKNTHFTLWGIVVLSCFKTSSMIARTVMLSWLQLSRMCTNVSIWGWPSEFVKTVVQYVAQYPDSTSIGTLETKTQFWRRPFQFSVNEVCWMKAEHFSFKMKVLVIWKLAKQSQKMPFCLGE